MKRTLMLLALSACVWALTFSNTAQANDYFHGGLPWFGYGYSGSLYGLGRIPVPPYHAIHPPVYYSHMKYRAYGWSPYAYSAGQPMDRPSPGLIMNRHVPSKVEALDAPAGASEAQTVAAPKVIINPYVHQPEIDSTQQLVKLEDI